MNEMEVPWTEQGLLDYIRYGEIELKRNEKRNKILNETIAKCKKNLTQLGWYFQDNQWRKHNAQHVEAIQIS